MESGGGTPDNPIIFRYTFENGKPVRTQVKRYVSEYEIKYKSHVVIHKYFSMSSVMVVNIRTREVLGELVNLSIYPSFIDSLFIGLTGTGSGFSPWHCGEEATPEYPKGIGDRKSVV